MPPFPIHDQVIDIFKPKSSIKKYLAPGENRRSSKTHRRNNLERISTPKTQNDILKMIETETILHKETLSPFNPLPAIGQRSNPIWDGRQVNIDIRKNLSDITLKNLEQRKLSSQNYYIFSVNTNEAMVKRYNHKINNNIMKEIEVPKELERQPNNDIKINQPDKSKSELKIENKEEPKRVQEDTSLDKSKPLVRQNTYNVLEPVILKGHKNKKVDFARQPAVKSQVVSLAKLCCNGTTDSEKNTNKDSEKKYLQANEVTEKKQSTQMPNAGKPNGPAICGNKLFEQRGKLLDRRKRESFPSVVIEEEDLKELKTAKDFKDIDNSDDWSSCSETESAHPKMRNLIDIFNSLQISRKYKESIRKTNNWF